MSIDPSIYKKTVFVGMSGGVDSSVTAALLKQRGFNVIGVHLRCWNVNGCAEQDAEDARRAAEVLGIPFYVFDFEKEYRERVVQYMVEAYGKGITPNPDVACNQEIKFGLFYKRAMEMGADYVATGHYVRLRRHNPNQRMISEYPKYSEHSDRSVDSDYTLYAARDKDKDQSYFLWTLTKEQIKHCLFPLGNLIKRTQVRNLAKKFNLPNAEKKDSQGICFIGPITLKDFLAEYIPAKRGKVLTTTGKVIGEHTGAQFYTIGQRHIGVANRRLTRTARRLTRKTDFKPLYVADKDIKTNTLIMAEGDDNPALYKKEIILSDVNFINPKLHATSYLPTGQAGRLHVWVRVRYRQPLFKARITRHIARSKKTEVRLQFDAPQKAVAPGQSAVFYSKTGELLGGGIIAKAN